MQLAVESPMIRIKDEEERDLLCRSLSIVTENLNMIFTRADFPFRLDMRGIFIEIPAQTLEDGTHIPHSPIEEGDIRALLTVNSSVVDMEPLTGCETCKGEGYYFDQETLRSIGCEDCEAVAILNERHRKFHSNQS